MDANLLAASMPRENSSWPTFRLITPIDGATSSTRTLVPGTRRCSLQTQKSRISLPLLGDVIQLHFFLPRCYARESLSSATAVNPCSEWDCVRGRSSDSRAVSPAGPPLLRIGMFKAVGLLMRFDPIQSQQIGQEALEKKMALRRILSATCLPSAVK